MNVRELIEERSKLDGDQEVKVQDWEEEYWGHADLKDSVQHQDGYVLLRVYGDD